MRHAFPLACCALAIVCSHVSAARSTWPLSPESASNAENITWGELENGFRYALLPTEDEVDAAVSFRLVVEAGASDQAEEKRGVARLLSHMAFEGANSWSDGALFDFLTRHGMEFSGAGRVLDGIDHTVFSLDFDLMGPAEALRATEFLYDVAGNLEFEARQVALELETLAREIRSELESDLQGESNYDRLIFDGGFYRPILRTELVDSVLKLSADDVREFYESNYRSNRMTLFVVGDFDREALESQIQSLFGNLASGAERSDSVERSRNRGTGDILMIEDRIGFARLALVAPAPETDFFQAANENRFWEAEIIGRYAQHVVDQERRFDAGAVFAHRGRVLTRLEAQGPIPTMDELIRKVDTAGRRLLAEGIDPTELERLKAFYAQLLASRDVSLSQKEFPDLLADRFVASLRNDFPFRYGDGFAAYLKAVHDGLSSDAAIALCEEFYNPKKTNLIFTLPEGIALKSSKIQKRVKALRKRYTFDWAVAKGQTSDWEIKPFFGQSGVVVSTETFDIGDGFGLEYVFQNSLRANLVRLPEQGNGFTLRLSLGNGLSDFQGQFSAADRFLTEVLKSSSLGNHSQAPGLYKTLTKKGLHNVGTGIDQGQVYWQVDGYTEQDLFNALALLAEWILSADIRSDDFDDAKEQAVKLAENYNVALNSVEREAALYGDEYRLRNLYDTESIEGLAYEDVRSWLVELAKSGYLELSIAGEVEPRRALRDMRKTLGALEKRSGRVGQPRHGSPARYPKSGEHAVESEGRVASTRISAYWPLSYESGCQDLARIGVLEIALERYLNERLRGFGSGAFDLSVGRNFDWMIPGSAAIKVNLDCEPEKAKSFDSLLQDWIADFPASLGEERVRACERRIAIEYAEKQIERDQIIALIDQSQAKPAMLKCARSIANGELAMSLEDYVALAEETFALENRRKTILEVK